MAEIGLCDGSRGAEEQRRELAKTLRAATNASPRKCEKALASHGDDIQQAANWLLSQAGSEGGNGEALAASG